MSRTILIDCDDVMIDHIGAWCLALHNKYGTDVWPWDITEWDIEKFFPTLTREEIFSVYEDEGFWDLAHPKAGAAERIQDLMDEGFEIYICTASDYRSIKEKYERVIKKHFPFIEWKDVIICNNKEMVFADCIVDDGIHNLMGNQEIRILYDMPHNQNFDSKKNRVIRCDNWDQIYAAIHRWLD